MNRDGFIPFFREQFGKIVVLLIAMGASRSDADDAVQEAMVLAWQEWESIQKPAAWTRTVAVRKYLRHARSRVNQTVSLDESGREPADPADLHIFSEEQQNVLRLLRGLPPAQRAIAALFYDGMACEEIADVLGRTPATVRSQLRNARETLKETRRREAYGN